MSYKFRKQANYGTALNEKLEKFIKKLDDVNNLASFLVDNYDWYISTFESLKTQKEVTRIKKLTNWHNGAPSYADYVGIIKEFELTQEQTETLDVYGDYIAYEHKELETVDEMNERRKEYARKHFMRYMHYVCYSLFGGFIPIVPKTMKLYDAIGNVDVTNAENRVIIKALLKEFLPLRYNFDNAERE